MTSRPIKYVAELSHVREVSLLGTADLSFWTERLQEEGLVPEAVDGKAQVMVVAADARFRGVRFREVSFSIIVRRDGAVDGGDASFLLHAFNSSRFFAFCERVFFSTPYYPAAVRVSAGVPTSIDVRKGTDVLFAAQMGRDMRDRAPIRYGPGGWEGPVFLPRGRRNPGGLFHARINGETSTYSFLPGSDSMTLRPTPRAVILNALVVSNFAPTEWQVRGDARHAKSRTYPRSRWQREQRVNSGRRAGMDAG